jgi:hypothetical protein
MVFDIAGTDRKMSRRLITTAPKGAMIGVTPIPATNFAECEFSLMRKTPNVQLRNFVAHDPKLAPLFQRLYLLEK